MKKYLITLLILLMATSFSACADGVDQGSYDEGYNAGYEDAYNDALSLVRGLEGGATHDIITDAVKYEGIKGYDNVCEYYRYQVEIVLEDNMNNLRD